MDSNSETSSSSSNIKKSPFDDLNRDELINKCRGLLLIAQKSKQAKAEVQQEIDICKSNLDELGKKNKSLEDNVQTLQELVNSLTEQKLNYITEIDSAHNKVKALSVKCNDYEEEINKYKANLIISEKKITDATLKFSNVDSEIVSLRRQNNRLVQENEQLIYQLTELENKAEEFNKIGLQQRQQLEMLEEKVQADNTFIVEINALKTKIKDLENFADNKSEEKIINYENKIKEVTELYESEKSKKERANIKLKSYRDKILKCAACINQLKNSRFILSKTVKEYSENIPKWQNDIIKASKILEDQVNQLNNENKVLKENMDVLNKQLQAVPLLEDENFEKSSIGISELTKTNKSLKLQLSQLQQQLDKLSNENTAVSNDFVELNAKYKEIKETQLQELINENILLKDKLERITVKSSEMLNENEELTKKLNSLNTKNNELTNIITEKPKDNGANEILNLQIKALESEKSILVKEKSNAREMVAELENHNRNLTTQLDEMKSKVETLTLQLNAAEKKNTKLEKNYKTQENYEVNDLKREIATIQSQNNLLKKQHDDMQDLNGLLREEVETLRLSLEQPKDDNLSDLNVSLQTDIAKLETKLNAYKQENSSLLSEIKENRTKMKEFDSIVAEHEEAKSKLLSYKSENAELLHEMKEINQVLKERGEAISKLQKAVGEMERLIETLEKDRDVVNEEKEQLSKRVEALENDLKTAEKKTENDSGTARQTISEKVNIIKEKETLIESMREEIEKLKQHQSSSELPNEDMSTSTISKAEEHSRMKDLDETFEERYTKLRIFALKLKKKLNETTSQLQKVLEDKAKLEKMLNENANKPVETQHDEVDSVRPSSSESYVSELEAKVESLTNSLADTNELNVDLQKIKAELASKIEQLAAEQESHKSTKNNLEKARKDIKKKSVLSLEMEDYERSMKDLTTKMEESKKKMIQMESTIDTQEGTITAMKTQIKLLEEQIKAEETQTRLTKEELHHALDELREKDNVVHLKLDIISKLERDLEDEKRKNEESDLETTSLLSEKEKMIISLGEDKMDLNNKVKKLEFKCADFNEKLNNTNIELADLKTEYTSYKVRAQSVLRQNQTVDHSQEEHLKEETAALKAQIETLTAKLNTLQEQFSEQSSELDASKRRASEATAEVGRAQQRTARLQSDLTRLSQQLESERSQQKLQVSTLTQCYKSQINELEIKLSTETDALRKQLVAVQEKANGVPRMIDDANRNEYMLPVIPKDDPSDVEMDINVSMIPREEGEGSESAPSPPLSKSFLTGGRRSPVPLERLLEEGVPDDDTPDFSSLSLSSEQEVAELRRKLQAQHQRVKHITVLLSESERECARMAQLSELLKSELRRARGTSTSEHNTEYMKNVTLKFLTIPPGDERSRLVPVLQKILTLTPEETNKIHAVARGQDPNPNKGWGSYLPWPGGK